MKILKPHNIISLLLLLIMAFSVTAPAPASAVSLYPGEVTQYQDQPLTPISTYIDYLNAHPDVAIKGAQYINQNTYQLAITGLVNNPTNYSYPDVVNNFNSTLEVATLPCVEGWSVTLLWQGVPIMDLLNSAGSVSPDANTIIFYASDGYSSSLPLDYIKQNNISGCLQNQQRNPHAADGLAPLFGCQRPVWLQVGGMDNRNQRIQQL
jgi:DMSO/TMAO reductase YedYZ molybdopterin-dependent catalytic subunit